MSRIFAYLQKKRDSILFVNCQNGYQNSSNSSPTCRVLSRDSADCMFRRLPMALATTEDVLAFIELLLPTPLDLAKADVFSLALSLPPPATRWMAFSSMMAAMFSQVRVPRIRCEAALEGGGARLLLSRSIEHALIEWKEAEVLRGIDRGNVIIEDGFWACIRCRKIGYNCRQ